MDISSLSNKLGLAAIGFAPSHDLADEYARLLDWLSHGYHGNMAWLAKSAKRRCYPSHIIAEPKSVIVCAMKYVDMPKRASLRGAGGDEAISSKQLNSGDCHAPLCGARNDTTLPKYLLHEDYHIIMMEKLEAVAAEIKKEYPDAKYKCYVDTGPVLEKAWGAISGIGFIGKNTLLISPEHGSQMALGVVVTDIPIDPTLTLPLRRGGNPCASCTACLDACPTKALVAPYVLDARKCISYKYFIEKREGGCDICQDVCPFNKENSHG